MRVRISASVKHFIDKEPTRDEFLAVGDDHVRFDIAAACVLLAEKDGNRERVEKVAREAVRAFPPGEWFYPMLRAIVAQGGSSGKGEKPAGGAEG